MLFSLPYFLSFSAHLTSMVPSYQASFLAHCPVLPQVSADRDHNLQETSPLHPIRNVLRPRSTAQVAWRDFKKVHLSLVSPLEIAGYSWLQLVTNPPIGRGGHVSVTGSPFFIMTSGSDAYAFSSHGYVRNGPAGRDAADVESQPSGG